jgi:hypothetical protein
MIMSGYGYEGLSEQNFVGFHTELTSGPWGAVEIGHAQVKRSARHEMPVLGFFKLLVVESIDGLVSAQGADNDVKRCDGPWDDAERRLVLTLQLKALDGDPAVRADAEQVQAQLCPGGSTSMTSLSADEEVDFARNQLKLARSPALSAAVARLGIEAHLDDVARCTDDLAGALGRSSGAKPVARWQRVAQAKRACVSTFNLAHEGLARLVETAKDPLEKANLTEMLAPFERLLARRVAAAPEPANEADAGEVKADEKAAEKMRPTG